MNINLNKTLDQIEFDTKERQAIEALGVSTIGQFLTLNINSLKILKRLGSRLCERLLLKQEELSTILESPKEKPLTFYPVVLPINLYEQIQIDSSSLLKQSFPILFGISGQEGDRLWSSYENDFWCSLDLDDQQWRILFQNHIYKDDSLESLLSMSMDYILSITDSNRMFDKILNAFVIKTEKILGIRLQIPEEQSVSNRQIVEASEISNISEITVNSFHMPKDIEKSLSMSGVKYWADLEQVSERFLLRKFGFTRTTLLIIDCIWRVKAFARAASGIISGAAVNGEDYRSFETMVKAFVNSAIKNPKHANVFLHRIGIPTGRAKTFKEIGVLSDLTRERVRQIVSNSWQVLIEMENRRLFNNLELDVFFAYSSGKSYKRIALDLGCNVKMIDNTIQRIKRKLNGKEMESSKVGYRNALIKFWIVVFEILSQHDGFIALTDLAEYLHNYFRWNTPPQIEPLRLIIGLHNDLEVNDTIGYVRTRDFECVNCEEAPILVNQIVKDNNGVMHIYDLSYNLVDHCRSFCRKTTSIPKKISPLFIQLVQKQIPDLYLEDQTVLMREKWDLMYGKNLKDIIKAVLNDIGKPVHYSAIAQRIREINKKYLKITDTRVHTCLVNGNYPDFTLAGRGTYGLSEWRLTPYKTHSEAIIDLLEGFGGAMRGAHIVSRLTRDGGYKENNIQAALYSHSRIVQVGDDTYDLRERIEEKYTANHADHLILNFDNEETSIEVKHDYQFNARVKNSDQLSEMVVLRRLQEIVTKNLKTSYKPVLMLSILDCINDDNACSLELTAGRFIDFYLEREAKGLPVESPEAEICFVLRKDPFSRLKSVKNILKQSPLQAFSSAGLFFCKGDSIEPETSVIKVLDNIVYSAKLRIAAGSAIINYFESLGEKL